MSDTKISYDPTLKAFSPRYCSKCGNRAMDETIMGRSLVRACPHYVFMRELTADEFRRKQEQVA